ncbi:MAG TPA: ABC transporter ATP-binding protein [Polyangiaceae bacterium]
MENVERTAAAASSIVEVEALHKSYASSHAGTDVHVLAGIELRVAFDEVVALTGPSGSGKSTLLNILGCLDRPTSGSYRLGGTDVSRLDREEQAWVRLHYLGFIFQSFHLIPHATALENASLPLHYAGVARGEAEQRARALLERVGLGERVRHFPNQLSGGERQRVAIARALVGSPKLVLADEPTGALDSKTGLEVMRLLLELHEEQGASMVLVTHDPVVARLAERRVCLLDGKIVNEEEPRADHA